MYNSYYYLKNLIRESVPRHLIDLAFRPMYDERFLKWPADISGHHPPEHNHQGGLVLHTAEVIQFALETPELTDTEKIKLILAGMWHDYGKIEQYDLIPGLPLDDISFTNNKNSASSWVKSSKYYTHYHVYISAREFNYWANMLFRKGWAAEDFEEIEHMILAHHGKREWKAVVEPQTKLARILHEADSKSARRN
jgi:23S rRNA maturation-related 3'-5' exoribonuclease YhaM